MTPEQTLAAAEVMRRAAEGEPVEARRIGAHDWHRASDPSWTWSATQYRIAEPPPHAPNAHNPDNLTPLQVETHLGWRLLDRDEIIDASLPAAIQQWLDSVWSGSENYGHSPKLTYRTKLTREELAEARGIRQPVPWSRPEHVPSLCWIRSSIEFNDTYLVARVNRDGVWTMNGSGNQKFSFERLAYADIEYSTDRVTWKPCTVTP